MHRLGAVIAHAAARFHNAFKRRRYSLVDKIALGCARNGNNAVAVANRSYCIGRAVQAVAYLRCEIAQFTNWGILFEYDLTVAIRENLQRVAPRESRIVRRISFGITTLPRSSIRLTIPVAFISMILRIFCCAILILCNVAKNM